jgi:iron(II)-dependent oxidoreductase
VASSSAAWTARCGGAADLARELQAARRDTLSTFAACARALPELAVPYRAELNPPLWELGHVGWFQEYWIARNPQRHRGVAADPHAPRAAGVRADGDALYDSGRVAHAARWSLPLPDAARTRADLEVQLAATLDLLARAEASDEALYFFRLALAHEDMHHEAALYMAQSLGVPIDDPRWQPQAAPADGGQIAIGAGRFELGADPQGFAFDNELRPHLLALGETVIDARVLRWAEYLPFVQDGGYRDRRLWTPQGQAWLAHTGAALPRALRRVDGGWQQWRYGRWVELDEALPAAHLTLFEAQAWCAWAGRRLPTEAEWERAAVTEPRFAWGQVWEWTASAFEPYPGFAPHPYRDYSAPWFGTRVVLRGASFMTQPRMRHPRYRNFFEPHRSDVPAGFRSCAR